MSAKEKATYMSSSMTRFENTLQRDPKLFKQWTFEYSETAMGRGDLKPVAFHKEVLGKQAFCLTLSRRYWVWVLDDGYLFVNNERGVDIEVPRTMTVEEVWAFWKHYREQTKL